MSVCSLLIAALMAAPASAPAGAAAVIGEDLEVVYESSGIPIHASLRAPAGGSTGVPGAVIIGGSGDIDRNGNSPAFPNPLDPYE
jgi:hypothetical protein